MLSELKFHLVLHFLSHKSEKKKVKCIQIYEMFEPPTIVDMDQNSKMNDLNVWTWTAQIMDKNYENEYLVKLDTDQSGVCKLGCASCV